LTGVGKQGHIANAVQRNVPYVGSFISLTGSVVRLMVIKMTDYHTRWWDSNVQPACDLDPGRADRGWNWPRIRLRTGLLSSVARKPARSYVLGIPYPPDHIVPCGMLLQVPCAAFDQANRNGFFIWYLADAPKSFLLQLVAPRLIPKACASILVDIAICDSFAEGFDGRIGLHAAPAGGQRLFSWYQKIGMINLPISKPIPINFRINDGRYFYHDEISAQTASNGLDQYR